MGLLDFATLFLTGTGAIFFIASTLGLLRFPDVYSRLHALTKADNVGLGLTVIGIAIQAHEASLLFKLLLVWLSVVISSAASCYLIARTARRMDI